MSQSPDEAVARNQLNDYVAAWQQVTRWSEEGRSFSGREKNCCFLNLGGEPFADVSAVTGLNFPDDSRGIAVVDWDHDGRQDLWLSARTAPQIRLLQNVAPESGHFLAVRLVGTSDQSNRDAIGATIEVISAGDGDSDQKRSVKTLQAGEGYLSQSSKWIHFGLGETTEIDSIRVRWPGGETETWPDISVDQHYLLEQSNPEPQTWARPAAAELTKGTPSIPTVTDKHHHLMSAVARIGELNYLDADGQPQSLGEAKKTKLLLLWASWCAPCIEELKELAKHYDKLSQDDVEILALSVDGLTDDETTFKDAKAIAERLQFPFTIGQATQELLAKLQSNNDNMFMSRRPLPLPSSFLVAPGLRLMGFYKGPVTYERILADNAKSNLSGDERMAAALADFGLGGHWQFPPRQIYSAALVRRAKSLLESNQVPDAEAHLRSAIEDDPSFAEAHFLLGVSLLKQPAKSASAQQALLKSIELAPDALQPRTMLADILLQQGQLEEAAKHYQQAIAIQPTADAHSNLGVISAMGGNQTAAIDQFQSAVNLAPANGRHLGNLGKALLDSKRYGESKQALEKAVATPKPAMAAMLNLSRILASAPNKELRNGRRAISLVQRCAKAKGPPDAIVLDRLAAAYAEDGQFDSAVATIGQAIGLARKAKRSSFANEMSRRKQLYEQRQPYRLE